MTVASPSRGSSTAWGARCQGRRPAPPRHCRRRCPPGTARCHPMGGSDRRGNRAHPGRHHPGVVTRRQCRPSVRAMVPLTSRPATPSRTPYATSCPFQLSPTSNFRSSILLPVKVSDEISLGHDHPTQRSRGSPAGARSWNRSSRAQTAGHERFPYYEELSIVGRVRRYPASAVPSRPSPRCRWRRPSALGIPSGGGRGRPVGTVQNGHAVTPLGRVRPWSSAERHFPCVPPTR